MSYIKILLGIYGVLMMVGGYIGYIKAGSKASLYMGIASGILILIGVMLMGNNPVVGYGLEAIISGLLVGVFLLRLLKTHAFMPSGMLLVLSVVALVLSLSHFFKK